MGVWGHAKFSIRRRCANLARGWWNILPFPSPWRPMVKVPRKSAMHRPSNHAQYLAQDQACLHWNSAVFCSNPYARVWELDKFGRRRAWWVEQTSTFCAQFWWLSLPDRNDHVCATRESRVNNPHNRRNVTSGSLPHKESAALQISPDGVTGAGFGKHDAPGAYGQHHRSCAILYWAEAWRCTHARSFGAQVDVTSSDGFDGGSHRTLVLNFKQSLYSAIRNWRLSQFVRNAVHWRHAPGKPVAPRSATQGMPQSKNPRRRIVNDVQYSEFASSEDGLKQYSGFNRRVSDLWR